MPWTQLVELTGLRRLPSFKGAAGQGRGMEGKRRG